MAMQRFFKHLMTGSMAVKLAFPARSMDAIEQAIRDTEARHGGQIRFAVEASLDYFALRHKQTAGERGIEIFSQLRVWDTEHNNGVLIYLLLADHDVEIIADRGIHTKLGRCPRAARSPRWWPDPSHLPSRDPNVPARRGSPREPTAARR